MYLQLTFIFITPDTTTIRGVIDAERRANISRSLS